MLFNVKRVITWVACGALCALALAAQEQKSCWKDRAEYDLYDSILKEQNPNTKLGLIQSWKEKYPATACKSIQLDTALEAYRAANRPKEMLAAAKDWIAADAKAPKPLIWANLLVISMGDTSPAVLQDGEKAGRGLLGILDEVYAPAKKPASVSDDAFKKDRDNTEMMANRTLGWVAMQRGQNDVAESFLEKVLKTNPGDGQASAWAGTVILKQKKADKQAEGLYHIARAAAYTGAGALPEATRKQYQAFFEKTYVNYHGSREGLDPIFERAKTEAFPAAGFTILSQDEINLKNELELEKTNPNLAFWIKIKRELAKPNGSQYFESSFKGAHIPGGAELGGQKLEKLKARIVSSKAAKPRGVKEIVVGLSSAEMSEITLRFEKPQMVTADPGTEIQFSGIPAEFTADPFNVTFDVEPEDVIGLPKAAPAKPAAAPKKGGAKKGAKK